MKRFIALTMILAMIFLMCACGSAVSENDKETEEPRQQEETVQPTELKLKEKTALPFVEFTLSTAETTKQVAVMSDRDAKASSYQSAGEGYTFVAVHGSIRNLNSESINLANAIGEIVLNETLTYSATVNAFHNNHLNAEIAPLEEAKLYIYAKVPEETADAIETCTLNFGFNDLLAEKSENAASSMFYYTITFSTKEDAENPYELNRFEPKPLSFGKEITTDFVELRFDELQVRNELEERYNGRGYSYATDPGMNIVCFVGTIKNTSKEEYNVQLTGEMDIDGYKYEIKDWELCSGLGVSPLSEVPIYLFAEVPPELATSFKECTLTFGFAENFTNNSFSEITMLPYIYSMKATPPQ